VNLGQLVSGGGGKRWEMEPYGDEARWRYRHSDTLISIGLCGRLWSCTSPFYLAQL